MTKITGAMRMRGASILRASTGKSVRRCRVRDDAKVQPAVCKSGFRSCRESIDGAINAYWTPLHAWLCGKQTSSATSARDARDGPFVRLFAPARSGPSISSNRRGDAPFELLDLTSIWPVGCALRVNGPTQARARRRATSSATVSRACRARTGTASTAGRRSAVLRVSAARRSAAREVVLSRRAHGARGFPFLSTISPPPATKRLFSKYTRHVPVTEASVHGH